MDRGGLRGPSGAEEDLQWLVNQGQADRAAATILLRQLEAQKASRDAEGTQFKESAQAKAGC